MFTFENPVSISLRAKFALAFFVTTFFASASAWTVDERTDAMTDKVGRVAVQTSLDGSVFSLLRKSDNSVWAYLKLANLNQFMVGERLLIRIDKNKPIEFDEDMQKLTAKLGRPISSWEWNPNLIGFRVWHGDPKEGCGTFISELLQGTTMIIRYHPNQSTTRDIVFNVREGRAAISRALDLDLSRCR